MLHAPVDAAEYQYFSGHTPNWRTSLLEWLHKQKPTPENVTAGITGNFDIYVYAVTGQFAGTYTIQHGKHPDNKASGILRALVHGGTGNCRFSRSPGGAKACGDSSASHEFAIRIGPVRSMPRLFSAAA
jgi:hypothetical protein